MAFSEFELMQKAVDIVSLSEHPTNKVSAAIAGKDSQGKEFHFARTNFWPEPIKTKIGSEMRIGNSSGTVHAETACLIDAPVTKGAAIFVTDVPCPNCVKNMAEAGIKALYIDHKGFTKDFALRRGGHFESMSLRICEKAGINIFRVYRKESRSEQILKISDGFSPVIEKPARVKALEDAPSKELFAKLIEQENAFYQGRPFAVAFAEGQLGKSFIISAETHPCPGYTAQTLEKDDEKYSTILQPVNRVMMMAARTGLKINPRYLYSSRVPTSRELVDMIGAGLSAVRIGDLKKARDNDALTAFDQLMEAGILSLQ